MNKTAIRRTHTTTSSSNTGLTRNRSVQDVVYNGELSKAEVQAGYGMGMAVTANTKKHVLAPQCHLLFLMFMCREAT